MKNQIAIGMFLVVLFIVLAAFASHAATKFFCAGMALMLLGVAIVLRCQSILALVPILLGAFCLFLAIYIVTTSPPYFP